MATTEFIKVTRNFRKRIIKNRKQRFFIIFRVLIFIMLEAVVTSHIFSFHPFIYQLVFLSAIH